MLIVFFFLYIMWPPKFVDSYFCRLKYRTFPFLIQRKFQANLLRAKGLGSKENDEIFVCQECGQEHIKWVVKCTSCQTWNSVKSFRPTKQLFESPRDVRRSVSTSSWVSSPSVTSSSSASSSIPTASSSYSTSDTPQSFKSTYNCYTNPVGNIVNMNDIVITEEKNRIIVPFSAEVNRVLGGGLVMGSVTLCAGTY